MSKRGLGTYVAGSRENLPPVPRWWAKSRRLLAPVALIAAVAMVILRVWSEHRRSGRSLADLNESLEAVAADAYERMSPDMRAEVDAERDASN